MRVFRLVLRANNSTLRDEKTHPQRHGGDRRDFLRDEARLEGGARPGRDGARGGAGGPPARGVARADGGRDLAPHRSRSNGAPQKMNAHVELRDAVRALCKTFDSAYWQRVDEARAYPEEFVDALTKAGWMSALIPEEFGGSGLSLTEASVIMEEITRSGGNAGCCHGQMYNMNTLLRNGSPQQKKRYLPRI